MKWRYSLRWKLPHRACPGPHELVSEVVEAGQPAPDSVMARWWPATACAGDNHRASATVPVRGTAVWHGQDT